MVEQPLPVTYLSTNTAVQNLLIENAALRAQIEILEKALQEVAASRPIVLIGGLTV